MYRSIALICRHSALIIKLSMVLHVFALLLIFISPIIWPWLLATIILNHLVLTAISLWPRSQCLGTNWAKLPAAAIKKNEIALTIDDGPDPEVTPQVLAILDQHQVKATFFCIGDKVQLHPDLCQEIIHRGHAIENHTQHHQHTFSLLGPNGFTKEIQAAQNTLTSITGQEPKFFRAPAGLRNPFLDTVLKKLNLTLASWTVRGFDTKNSNAEIIKTKLISHLKAGTILLLHDGNAARSHQGIPVILEVLPDLLKAGKTQGLHFITLRQAL
ncbi:MAG: polysaccharide deacetylase family protein [Methylophilaceae bacterium]